MQKSKEILSIVILLSLCFFTYVYFGLHGFSMGIWNNLLENKNEENIIWRKTQNIRTDDSIATIPIFLSEYKTTPQFAKYNNLIGQEPVNVSPISLSVPHYDWISVFRPEVWGGFISPPNQALAWTWITRSLMLFLSAYLFSRIFISPFYSFFVSLTFLYARFFQYWSLNMEPITSGTILAATSFYYFWKSKEFFRCILFWFCFLYSTLMLIFGHIYPPWQIIGLLFLTFFNAGVIFSSSQTKFFTHKIILIFFSAISTLCLLSLFSLQNQSAIELIKSTIYPGKRVSLGGESSIFDYLAQMFFYHKHFFKSYYNNICESAGFTCYFFIFFYLLFKIKKFNFKSIQFFILLFAILLFSWMFLPLPLWFGRITGLYLSPTYRAYYGFGFIELVGMIFFIRHMDEIFQKKHYIYLKKTIYSYIVFLLILSVYFLIKHPSDFPILVLGLCFSTLLLFFIMNWNKKAYFVGFCLLLVANTIYFNPISHHTYENLTQNETSQTILHKSEQFRERFHREPIWSFTNILGTGNIFRILGVKSIDGVHPYPQFSFWDKLDPQHKFINMYNRYAHVVLYLCETCSNEMFDIEGSFDLVNVYMSINSKYFDVLGIDYILIPKSVFHKYQNQNKIWNVDNSVQLKKFYLLEKSSFKFFVED